MANRAKASSRYRRGSETKRPSAFVREGREVIRCQASRRPSSSSGERNPPKSPLLPRRSRRVLRRYPWCETGCRIYNRRLTVELSCGPRRRSPARAMMVHMVARTGRHQADRRAVERPSAQRPAARQLERLVRAPKICEPPQLPHHQTHLSFPVTANPINFSRAYQEIFGSLENGKRCKAGQRTWPGLIK